MADTQRFNLIRFCPDSAPQVWGASKWSFLLPYSEQFPTEQLEKIDPHALRWGRVGSRMNDCERSVDFAQQNENEAPQKA